MQLNQSTKLAEVCYDIRGPVLQAAKLLEAQGHRILKLNIGNPAPFGFTAPDEILVDVCRNLSEAQGYSDSQGLLSARTAIVQHYQSRELNTVTVDDVWLGNGVSELIVMALQAMLNNGDEVLLPAPDYPLWTAATSLSGGRPVHYLCDESEGWLPDLDDMKSKITARTRAIVVINPNNPTGAVYPEATLQGIAELARQHDLVVLADEIYDKILYDDASHTPFAVLAPDLFTLTFNGLSKAYRLAGYRSGWLMAAGPEAACRQLPRGPVDPGQHAAVRERARPARGPDRARRPAEHPGPDPARRPVAGAARRRRPGAAGDPRRELLRAAGGAVRVSQARPERYPIADDQQFVLDFLREQHVLLVQGTGFNWPRPDHLRIVTLPHTDMLTQAIRRLGASWRATSQRSAKV